MDKELIKGFFVGLVAPIVAYVISKFDFFLEFPLSVKLNFVFTSINCYFSF